MFHLVAALGCVLAAAILVHAVFGKEFKEMAEGYALMRSWPFISAIAIARAQLQKGPPMEEEARQESSRAITDSINRMHVIDYEQHELTTRYRVVCSCGWESMPFRSYGHRLDWRKIHLKNVVYKLVEELIDGLPPEADKHWKVTKPSAAPNQT